LGDGGDGMVGTIHAAKQKSRKIKNNFEEIKNDHSVHFLLPG
jgi:hypothetical protein